MSLPSHHQRKTTPPLSESSGSIVNLPLWNTALLISEQGKATLVVELDFLYPSEGIHNRWESGYKITSMAATADQAAFILGIPKRKMTDETQVTLRTYAFPSTHVKVSWMHNRFFQLMR
ncbi:hypothetical protein L1887_21848 [Cichorium endivia]|nr:hypothetical protein L1887_21848 [Cichorium endivia]